MSQRLPGKEPRRFWSAEDDARMRELYPDTPTKDLALTLKRTRNAVYARADTLGLRKSAAYLRAHPYNSSRHRLSLVAYQRKALDIASIAVYSILRDWIKGQVTAIETGILSFEGAFLGQLMLPTGRTVLEEYASQHTLIEGPASA